VGTAAFVTGQWVPPTIGEVAAYEAGSGPGRGLRPARVLTFAAAAAAPLTTLVLPGIGLWYEPGALRTTLGGLGIGAVALTQTGALYAAVTPWLAEPVRRRLLAAFGVAAALSVPLVAPVGAGQWATWAWLGGSIAGTAPMVLRRWAAALAVLACFAATLGAAAWTGGSPVYYAATTLWLGLAVAMTALPVWLWSLLVQVQRGRAAQARLAVTEERLRFARDVHDLLGHHLSVIALKAELAARLAARDPEQAGEHAAEAQRLAAAALAQTRAAVHGYRRVDLADQLGAVAQVLRSSGVRCTATGPPAEIAPEIADQLAAVLREAGTNLLRHSRASWCRIEITQDQGGVRMTVANDGAHGGGPDRHSYGLRGLAERLAGVGGVLRTHREDGVFTLEANVPVVAAAP
jgi:two-component system sensor histidine kinase DesK